MDEHQRAYRKLALTYFANAVAAELASDTLRQRAEDATSPHMKTIFMLAAESMDAQVGSYVTQGHGDWIKSLGVQS